MEGAHGLSPALSFIYSCLLPDLQTVLQDLAPRVDHFWGKTLEWQVPSQRPSLQLSLPAKAESQIRITQT